MAAQAALHKQFVREGFGLTLDHKTIVEFLVVDLDILHPQRLGNTAEQTFAADG